MANLIITIISIALVAVAALMGAYYGGNAFINAQNKARAGTLVTQSSQIIAALKLWQIANYADITLGPAWNGVAGTSSSLVPDYLTQIPRPPAGYNNWLVGYVNSSGFMETVGDGGIVGQGSLGANAYVAAVYTSFSGTTDSSALAVCSQMNNDVAGSKTVPTLAGGFLSADLSLSNVFSTLRARCFIDSSESSVVFAFKL